MVDSHYESIPRMLKRYGIRPSKSLGQNFLVDPTALESVISAAEISMDDEVLEIGPGLGSLTRRLAEISKRVVAIEIDKKFTPILNDGLAFFENVELIFADILEVDVGDLFDEPGYIVVANIPYYITSALLRHFFETPQLPARLTFTVQKEVAERICAGAGQYSLLALSVQVYGHPRIVAKIPAGAFYPAPKVDSSIVRVDIYDNPLIQREKLDSFFQLTKAGFSQKRKTLRNSLAGGMRWGKEKTEETLLKADIDPQRRAQTLTIEEWARLVDCV